MEREATLADFEGACHQWEAAFAKVPDGALTFLKPGDDYALGGLQVHVNWVLVHYLRVLDGILAAGFAETAPRDPSADVRRALEGAKHGLMPAERRSSLAEMAKLHATVRSTIRELPEEDWSRKASVIYGEGQDPYPTSPEDIIGWLRDHYREHVDQSADLIAEWRAMR